MNSPRFSGISLHEASDAIHQRRMTCRELTERCLQRIEERERDVRAWVFVDADGALSQASLRDDELAAGRDRGPLHGIPIGIKDIIDVANWPTVAGYPPWSGQVAHFDATVVTRLQDRGAILLGKTVTTQFAGFDPPPTGNPWNVNHTPGGSSSGSAAAVAAGMCLGAIGTQTGGSITRPASFCGDAACKPTFGRIDLTGIVPLSSSMDHVGPIAANVRDVAMLLEAIDAPATNSQSESKPFSTDWNLPELSSLRIGRLRGFFETMADPEMNRAIEKLIDRLTQAGTTVGDVAWPRSFDQVLQNHKKLIAAGAAVFHRERFLANPQTFLPQITKLVSDGLSVGEEERLDLVRSQAEARNEMLTSMEPFDAIICPATRGVAPDRSTTGDPSFNAPWSYTGLPVVSFRIGWSHGLPLCLQCVGRPFDDRQLLRISGAMEMKAQGETSKP